MSFFRHGRSIGPMYGKQNRGTEAPLLIVHDESHRLSLGGVLSSRARFRFARQNHCSCTTTCRFSTSGLPLTPPEPRPARSES